MCAVVRHVSVGQKISDVNDVELPYLECLPRNVTKLSHVLCPESEMVDVTYCHTCISLDFGRTKSTVGQQECTFYGPNFCGIPIDGYNSSLK